MQYVVLTRHFPQKSLSRNPKIGFPLSPLLDHALLPLTHDLTTSRIGWLQVGNVGALRMLYFCVCPKSVCCSCVCRNLGAFLHILPPILDFLWHELLLIPHSLWPAPFRAGLYLIVGFFSFNPFFYSFLQFCISCCTILSFLLWCYLTQACWASLGLSFILLLMT